MTIVFDVFDFNKPKNKKLEALSESFATFGKVFTKMISNEPYNNVSLD